LALYNKQEILYFKWYHQKGNNMLKKIYFNSIKIITSLFLIGSLSAQLEVGDISPDFAAPVCMNDNTEDGEWSLLDEGLGKVIWLDLYTSW
jgi:hypothetical protein